MIGTMSLIIVDLRAQIIAILGVEIFVVFGFMMKHLLKLVTLVLDMILQPILPIQHLLITDQ